MNEKSMFKDLPEGVKLIGAQMLGDGAQIAINGLSSPEALALLCELVETLAKADRDRGVPGTMVRSVILGMFEVALDNAGCKEKSAPDEEIQAKVKRCLDELLKDGGGFDKLLDSAADETIDEVLNGFADKE